jgi:hypothetical protein
MAEEKAVKEVSKDKYVLKEIIVQKDIAVGVEGTDEVFTEKGLLVEILNKLDKIEKAVA